MKSCYQARNYGTYSRYVKAKDSFLNYHPGISEKESEAQP